MERGQFYHYETYGRKESDAKKKKNCSIYSILGEAFREKEYSSHVDINETIKYPPKILFTDIVYDENINNKKLEIQNEYLKNLAEKYAKAKQLKMKDGCILAGVVSYPPETTFEMMNNIQKTLVLPFLKRKWGKNLRCVLSHSDEYFWDDEKKIKIPHYQDHFYVIPDADDEIRLTMLHAGMAAKRKAIAGKADEKGKKHSDKAYREAMIGEQNEFFNEVGERAGWKRKTVNGVRYKREEIKSWKRNQLENELIINEAEIKREELINNGNVEADRLKQKALNEARKECSNITTKAIEEKVKAIEEAKDILRKANINAEKIHESAKKEASIMYKKIKIIIKDLIRKFIIPSEKNKVIKWVNARVQSIVNPKKTITDKNYNFKKRI